MGDDTLFMDCFCGIVFRCFLRFFFILCAVLLCFVMDDANGSVFIFRSPPDERCQFDFGISSFSAGEFYQFLCRNGTVFYDCFDIRVSFFGTNVKNIS